MSLLLSMNVIPLLIELKKYHWWGFFYFILLKYVHFTHPWYLCICVSVERDLQLVERAEYSRQRTSDYYVTIATYDYIWLPIYMTIPDHRQTSLNTSDLKHRSSLYDFLILPYTVRTGKNRFTLYLFILHVLKSDIHCNGNNCAIILILYYILEPWWLAPRG